MQLLQCFDEASLLFFGGSFGAVVPDVGKPVVLGGVHAVDGRQVVFFGEPLHQRVHFFAETGGEQVSGQRAELRNAFQRRLYLRAELLLYLLDVPFLLHDGLSRIGGVREHHRVEIAVLVRQAGAVGQRTPLHVLPLAGDDEVQADVQSRIFFQHLDGFWIPGCYGHHFHAAGNTRAVGLDAGFVDGMQGTEIVNADDKCRGAGLSPYRQCSCCEQASGNHVFQS